MRAHGIFLHFQAVINWETKDQQPLGSFRTHSGTLNFRCFIHHLKTVPEHLAAALRLFRPGGGGVQAIHASSVVLQHQEN